MGRKIAEKMQDAKRRIPHIAYVEECDLTELEALRLNLNAQKAKDQPKLTLLPILIRALVRVLPDFPQINARYDMASRSRTTKSAAAGGGAWPLHPFHVRIRRAIVRQSGS